MPIAASKDSPGLAPAPGIDDRRGSCPLAACCRAWCSGKGPLPLSPPPLSKPCARCCARRATRPARPRSASTVSAGFSPAPGGLPTGSRRMPACCCVARASGGTLPFPPVLLPLSWCMEGPFSSAILRKALGVAEGRSPAAAKMEGRPGQNPSNAYWFASFKQCIG